MAIRKVYAPYSTTGEQVGQTPVEGYIDVKQEITPIILTGELGKDGEWSGVTVSDKQFLIDTTHEAVANTARVIVPQAQPDYIDMTGYRTLFIAIKTSATGNHEIEARMGTDTQPFSNLQPVSAITPLRGCYNGIGSEHDIELLFKETVETLTADVWNIFIIQGRLEGQKNLVFTIDNDTGGIENIQFAYMRVV